MRQHLKPLIIGMATFAAVSFVFPAESMARTRTTEQYYPGNPYTGRGGAVCQTTTVKKHHFLGSDKSSTTQCAPTRNPGYGRYEHRPHVMIE
jgi:hypothetical protein